MLLGIVGSAAEMAIDHAIGDAAEMSTLGGLLGAAAGAAILVAVMAITAAKRRRP